MAEKTDNRGLLKNVDTSVLLIKRLIDSVRTLVEDETILTELSKVTIKEILESIKEINLELADVPITLDKTYEIIKDIINSVSKSRVQLQGAVEGLIKQTGEQITKVTSATEEATQKMLDVSDALTEKQNNLVDKLDKLVEEKPELKTELEEIKNDVYEQQDDAFMILDHLQFQDITSQQLEGAFSMLGQIEEKLLIIANLLEGLDELSFSKMKKSNAVFDSDAEFKDQAETQAEIDKLLNASASNEILQKSSQDEIDKLVNTDVSSETPEKSSQDEIDKLLNGL